MISHKSHVVCGRSLLRNIISTSYCGLQHEEAQSSLLTTIVAGGAETAFAMFITLGLLSRRRQLENHRPDAHTDPRPLWLQDVITRCSKPNTRAGLSAHHLIPSDRRQLNGPPKEGGYIDNTSSRSGLSEIPPSQCAVGFSHESKGMC